VQPSACGSPQEAPPIRALEALAAHGGSLRRCLHLGFRLRDYGLRRTASKHAIHNAATSFTFSSIAKLIQRLRDNGGLDLAAAIHQLLKDAVKFVKVRVPGNERRRLESSPAIRSSALRQIVGVWWKVARRVMSL